jgi:hypothetical protein
VTRATSLIFCGLLLSFSSEARADGDAPLPKPALLALGARGGVGLRLGDPPYFPATGRGTFLLGATALFEPNDWLGLGAAFEHAWLDREAGPIRDIGSAEVQRTLNTMWLDARVRVFERDQIGVFLGLGPGITWQSESATGYVHDALGANGVTFSCSASDSANFALRAMVGATYGLSPGFRVTTEFGVDNYRLSSDVLDDCAPGAGTATVVGARIGIAYAIDVDRYVR